MRPLMAAVVAAMIFGSVKAYMLFQASLPPPERVQSVARRAAGQFSLEITLTFDAAPDDFALQPASAIVQLGGREIFRSAQRLAAGEAIVIEEVAGIVEGINTFYVEIAPAESSFDTQHAVRLRVLRDGEPFADQTLWSRPGEAIQDTVDLHVAGRDSVELSHEH